MEAGCRCRLRSGPSRAKREEALRGGEWWPVHPLDAEPGDPDVFHGIYLGAAGVLWALHHLAQAGLHQPHHDHARLAEDVSDSYLTRPEFDGPLPSLWMGEGGIALVAYGSTEEILGPAHGLAGVVAALARRPDLLPAGRLRPRRHGGAVGHRGPRRRRARELAACAPPAPREAGRLHPHPVVPRRSGHRRLARSACPANGRARRAPARGRRADLGGGASSQGRGPLSRDRRQRPRAAHPLRPHRRRGWLDRAGASPCTPSVRSSPPTGARPRPLQPLDRRPRRRGLPPPMPRRRLRCARPLDTS